MHRAAAGVVLGPAKWRAMVDLIAPTDVSAVLQQPTRNVEPPADDCHVQRRQAEMDRAVDARTPLEKVFEHRETVVERSQGERLIEDVLRVLSQRWCWWPANVRKIR